jgi:aldehyde dehydrogenase (NAD+)
MASKLIREPALYIGGRWVPGGGTDRDVENPATEITTGLVTQASRADVDQAAAAAHAALDGWRATPVGDRAAALRRLHKVITDRADCFAALITREQGSPAPLARNLHVDTPLRVLTQTADALEQFPFRQRQDTSVILREPVGVVATITPWNMPLHQIIVKVVPALAAGCTVVLKPSTLTPLTAFELSRAVDAAGFPPGVFNLVTGAGSDIGQRLCGHPLIDHVSFTGSPAVGRQVAAAAAGTAKSLTLEVGGKSASIVLSDVSDELLAKAVKDTVANCFLNCGQTSAALSRLIVPRVRQAQVEEWAAAEAARYVPGRGLGPLISAGHRFAVEGYLEPSLAEVITGTVDLPAIGYYVTPTVYSDVDPASDLAQDEVFGPVLSILTAESDDHAIQLVNDSNYGLGGALWIEDAQRALDWAARIRAGQVAVNAAPFGPGALIGGYKQYGSRQWIGDYGINDMLETKAVAL